MTAPTPTFVMPGLDPGIQGRQTPVLVTLDYRVKTGNDDGRVAWKHKPLTHQKPSLPGSTGQSSSHYFCGSNLQAQCLLDAPVKPEHDKYGQMR